MAHITDRLINAVAKQSRANVLRSETWLPPIVSEDHTTPSNGLCDPREQHAIGHRSGIGVTVFPSSDQS
jgi:hypothetical protein